MVALAIILLILGAILFGLFFLVFKLIWILAKNNGNKWPLILSGITTVGFIVIVSLSVWMAVQRFIKPFDGLIQAGKAKTTVTDNTRIYNDPQYRFSITTYGDTQFSDWMNLEGMSLLAGFDLNTIALMKQKTKTDDLPLNFTLIFRQHLNEPAAPQKIYAETIAYLEQINQSGTNELSFSEPVFDVPAGPNNAMYAEGTITSNNGLMFHLYLLNAAEGNENYIVLAVVNGNQTYLNRAARSVQSFRLPSRAASPQLSYTE